MNETRLTSLSKLLQGEEYKIDNPVYIGEKSRPMFFEQWQIAGILGFQFQLPRTDQLQLKLQFLTCTGNLSLYTYF